ncbi:winged helix DNA-binding domain-containing protein [Isoptericola sp. S6320L]|uniref:winged helix-turn-helix domain-containing protein n=1 Tax=Isoptericola sp. S6320L TaxID=2926411 RepID=UPI001FF16746|nr:crosslink repair DNA glycosylase YcaQ family protein [Isoptericola sp. S6320L]MCK0118708.1 winged helix DNA-binding domain-containing protein [Isoptericola sp. S6320L]
MESMSITEARRVALRAQSLDRGRPDGPVTMRRLTGAVDRLNLLQIDSVNVLARAHLVPLYSRLGPYDTGLLERAAGRAPRRLVETWAHVASYVPTSTYPLLEWRRRAYQREAWGSIAAVPQAHPHELELVRSLVTELGPVTGSRIHDELERAGRTAPRSRLEWGWNWTTAKRCLEYLFFTGEVMSARRNSAFERCYDLPERVLPPALRHAPGISDDDAIRRLLELGARAHGVGTARCFRDYFRLRGPRAQRALADLVDDGTLVPVDVDGWGEPTYRHRDAVLPRRATGSALLSPFDPLVWERRRLEALFDVFYRIEIYVPAHRRRLGYYVLPFLQGEQITAMVDLKADRPAGVLRVTAAHRTPHADGVTPAALAAELRLLADWLGLAEVAVVPTGDLAADLAADLSAQADGQLAEGRPAVVTAAGG